MLFQTRRMADGRNRARLTLEAERRLLTGVVELTDAFYSP
jgi:hypothetical protein